MDLIADCFYKHVLETIEKIYNASPEKTELSYNDIVTGFKTHYFPGHVEGKVKETTTKPKMKRKTKELEDHEQCIALKKTGDRCKGKKSTIGPNMDWCSLHNNSEKDKDKPQTVEIKEPTVKCSHIFTRGANKNSKCEQLSMPESGYCKTHGPKPKKDTAKSKETIEEETEVIEEQVNKKVPLIKRQLPFKGLQPQSSRKVAEPQDEELFGTSEESDQDDELEYEEEELEYEEEELEDEQLEDGEEIARAPMQKMKIMKK